jgi:dTDP-4-amino-4,6-dideoxygalactose transaminase
MTLEEAMERIHAVLAHAWMVRAFLKHAEEIQEAEDFLEVHRVVFDYIRALEPSYERRDAKEFVRRASGKLPKLQKAADFLALEYKRISDHTNFQMAADSLKACVEEIAAALAAVKDVQTGRSEPPSEVKEEQRGVSVPLQESGAGSSNSVLSTAYSVPTARTDPLGDDAARRQRYDLPALLGGKPARTHQPPSWPLAEPTVRQALEEAFQSGAWGKYDGGLVKKFEEELAAYHDVPHVITTASGTIAVELALRATGVGPGDEVIEAAYDYSGNFLTIHALSALPVLVDIDPASGNMDPGRLAGAITPATKAILVSHLHGGLVPMRKVMEVARARGIAVIEDAAQCPGATVQGRRAGTWGDAGVLSFGGSKLLTAGRGGAILTASGTIAQRARTWQMRGNLVAPLSELQAAVLRPQLTLLDEHNRKRASRVAILREVLRDVPGLGLFEMDLRESRPAYYKVGFFCDAQKFGLGRDTLRAALAAEGLCIDEGFRALHVERSPARYRAPGTLEHATKAHQCVLVLHHPILLAPVEAMTEIGTAVRKVHRHAAQLSRTQ